MPARLAFLLRAPQPATPIYSSCRKPPRNTQSITCEGSDTGSFIDIGISLTPHYARAPWFRYRSNRGRRHVLLGRLATLLRVGSERNARCTRGSVGLRSLC